eukprot:108037-Rhodomonas_salina.1
MLTFRLLLPLCRPPSSNSPSSQNCTAVPQSLAFSSAGSHKRTGDYLMDLLASDAHRLRRGRSPFLAGCH